MQPHDPNAPLPAAAAGPAPGASVHREARWPRARAAWLWTLGAGLLATVASWLLIEAAGDTFKAKATPMNFMGSTYMVVQADQRDAVGFRNVALGCGLMGATVGLALAMAGGLAGGWHRSLPAAAGQPLALGFAGGLEPRALTTALLAAVLGLALGAAAGAGTAIVAVPAAARLSRQDPGNPMMEMSGSILVHCGIWAAVGAAGGLAFWLGRGRRGRLARPVLGGLLGGLAGGLLYELIGALALPGAKLADPIAATAGLRLFAQAMAVIPAAIGIAVLAAQPTNDRSAPESTT